MRNLSLCLLVGVFWFYIGSCAKKDSCPYQNDNMVASASEQQAIKHYLDSMGITATLHPSGFYYSVAKGGSSVTPGVCSQITVAYSGQLTNGKIFDQQSSFVSKLGELIDGWKKGIPLIQKGGEIWLYIPPSLGYGSNDINDATGAVVIPGNSILIFDIKLLDVQ